MKKAFPIILMVAGLLLAIFGINSFQESTASVSFLGIDVNASDESGQTAGIMYLVIGAISLIAGYMMYRK